MKILYVLHQDPNGYPAGIEQHLLDLIGGLIPLGCSISLFFPKKDGYILRSCEGPLNYKESFFKGPIVDFDTLRNQHVEKILKDVLHTNKFDLVHFQSLRHLPLSLIEVAKDCGVPTIISLHEYFLWCIHFILLTPEFCNFASNPEKCAVCLRSQGYNHMTGALVQKRREYINELLHLVDSVVCPSDYVKALFLELYGLDLKERFHVIENGTDINSFVSTTRFSGSTLNVAFLGNFLRHKGSYIFEELLKSCLDIKNMKFFIIGNLYEKLSTHYPNLTIVGGYNRAHLTNILQKHSVNVALLLSVIPETFSFTLSEAVLNQIPVMGIDLGSIRERVARYKVGFLIPHESPVSYLKERLLFILANKDVLELFQAQCRSSQEALSTISKMTDEHVTLYSKIIN